MELDFNTGSEGGSGGETDGSESNLAAYGEGMVRAADWIGTHWVRAHLARQDPSQSEPEVRGAGFANSYEPAEIESGSNDQLLMFKCGTLAAAGFVLLAWSFTGVWSHSSFGLTSPPKDLPALSYGSVRPVVKRPRHNAALAAPHRTHFGQLGANNQPRALHAAVSIPTGTAINLDQRTSGRGELEAINGTRYDSYIVVMDADDHVRARQRYIKAQDSFTIDRLEPGRYRVLFATGIDWNAQAERFNCDASYFEFGSILSYKEARDAKKVYFDHFSITINSEADGTAIPKEISEGEFHALSGRS